MSGHNKSSLAPVLYKIVHMPVAVLRFYHSLKTQTCDCKTALFEVTMHTVKTVLSGYSLIDKTQILMTNGSLMKVESIAECSEHSTIRLTCIKR